MTAVPARPQTASRATRVKARLAAGAVGMALYFGALVVIWNSPESGAMFMTALVFAVLAVYLWLILAKGKTIGYVFIGLVAVDPATGRPAGGKLLVRTLLQGLVSGVTCGFAEPIVSYVSFDGTSTWFDRTAGVLVVHEAGKAAPVGTGISEASGVPSRSTATRVKSVGVTPVSRAHEGDLSDPTHLVDMPSSQGSTGWTPVETTHTPIQEIPGAGTSAPTSPVPQPGPSSNPPPRADGRGSAAGPALAQPAGGMITGVPWSSPPASAPAPTTRQPPSAERPQQAQTPPSNPPPAAALGQQMSSAVPDPGPSVTPVVARDHTVLDEALLDGMARTPILTLDDGQRVLIEAAVVLGRAPVPPAEHTNAAVVALADPTMKVSKTHALVTWDGTHVVVTDLGSTNGVRVALGPETPRRLTPRVPHQLLPGERVLVGGRSFEVAR